MFKKNFIILTLIITLTSINNLLGYCIVYKSGPGTITIMRAKIHENIQGYNKAVNFTQKTMNSLAIIYTAYNFYNIILGIREHLPYKVLPETPPIKPQEADFLAADSDWYKTLGLPKNIPLTEDVLRKAYLKKSFQWHPDKNPNNAEEANTMFQAIKEAYDNLTKVLKGEAEVPKSEYQKAMDNYNGSFSAYEEARDRYKQENDMLPIVRAIAGGAAFSIISLKNLFLNWIVKKTILMGLRKVYNIISTDTIKVGQSLCKKHNNTAENNTVVITIYGPKGNYLYHTEVNENDDYQLNIDKENKVTLVPLL